MSPKEKKKLKKVLVAEAMSSEESDDENEEVITVKPLPWRAEKVSSFFHCLDNKMKQSKSTQAKRQRKQRIEGSNYSLRLQPVGTSIPEWAFDTNINNNKIIIVDTLSGPLILILTITKYSRHTQLYKHTVNVSPSINIVHYIHFE